MQHWWPVPVLGLLLGCAVTEQEPTKNDVVAWAVANTVQVVTERPDGVRRFGSAVRLAGDLAGSRSLIITTHHLLAPEVEQQIYVRDPRTDEQSPLELVATDPDHDLALLAASQPDDAAAAIRPAAYLGDDVWVVAFPWGRERTVVRGVVSQVAPLADDGGNRSPIAGRVGLIDASVSYGMSGGGVFDAQTGDLLGIVRGYRTAQLALPGEGAPALRFPVAGETTVISAAEIGCFVEASVTAGGAPTSSLDRRC